MNKLIRLYNQNRTLVILLIIIIAFVIVVIQAWNSILENRIAENTANVNNSVNDTNTSNTVKANTNTSVITGETVNSSTDTSNTNVIEMFVEYCNEGQIESAYNMLSTECKELLYSSLEDFQTNYYNNIFYMQRKYNLETWYTSSTYSTYYITYTEDILSTGTTTSSDNKGDYITVVKSDEGYYINISSYVRKNKRG